MTNPTQLQTSGEFTVTSGGTPPDPIEPGVYQAQFQSWEPKEGGKFGPCIRLEFVITEGVYKDTTRDLLTSAKISHGSSDDRTSKLYKIIRTLLKRDLDVGEKVNLDKLVGEKCKIFVEDNMKDEQNWQRVSQVLQAKE